jgi:S1-C subfamily serine protease
MLYTSSHKSKIMSVREARRSLITLFRDSVVRVKASSNNIVRKGTGFFVSADGTLLTCNHVVSYFQPDEKGHITLNYFPRIEIETKQRGVLPAKIIHDLNSTHPVFEDYAILKADISSITPLRLGDHNSVQSGDDVLILGYPFGLPQLCATSGIVSAKHRSPSKFNAMVVLEQIRIDGSVNVGNSGGPLVDLYNQFVVGIVSIRLGDLSELIERLKRRGDTPSDLIEILETSNRYLNVGIGEAISIRYALNELRQLGIELP